MFLTDRMDCSFISGLVAAVLPLRYPMKSADSRLIFPASLTLLKSFRLGESRFNLSSSSQTLPAQSFGEHLL
jgi:hypothetical protein